MLYAYNREAAVAYAHKWAFGRNPRYYDFERLGGDCTNFASQCLFAGCGVMNYKPVFGWYYRSARDRAPAWTGVEYLHNFLVRPEATAGPAAVVSRELAIVQPGDVVQLRFDGSVFQHSPVVVEVRGATADDILVAAHSLDADFRPLSSYEYAEYRVLHIVGFYR